MYGCRIGFDYPTGHGKLDNPLISVLEDELKFAGSLKLCIGFLTRLNLESDPVQYAIVFVCDLANLGVRINAHIVAEVASLLLA